MTESRPDFQKAATKFVLETHKLALKGLLAIAILAGIFPIVFVCDDGKVARCIGYGLLFFGAVAGPSLCTVGLATLALIRPGRRSRLYLIAYSVFLMGCLFYFPGWTNFQWLRDGLAALGALTLLCVLFFGAGRNASFRD